MRLLIVNPNTSDGVTVRIDAAARAVVRPGDRFTTVSAASGPRLIVTDEDSAAATEGVLQAVSAHGAGVDGIVLASFGDTGAGVVRRRYPGVPVVGIAEAAFEVARRIGGRLAIVTFAPEVVPSLRDMARHHGMHEALGQIAAVDGPLRHDPSDVADRLFPQLRDLCLSCASNGADSVILGGGPLAGLAGRIGPDCPVPVIDGTQAAIAQLRAVVAARARPADLPT